MPVLELSSNQVTTSSSEEIQNPWIWIHMSYFIGLFLMLILRSAELFKLRFLHLNSKPQNGFRAIPNSADIFSFWNHVYIGDQNKLSDIELSMILAHEKAHIQKKHSLDILFLTVLEISFWFVPIWPKLKKEFKLLHELEVDQEVSISHDRYQYARLLVRMASGRTRHLVHHFAQFITEKRLEAMLKHKNSVQKSIRIITMGFGFLICSMLALSCLDDNSENEYTDTHEAQPLQLEIDKNSEEDILSIAEEMPYLKSCQGVKAEKTACLLQKIYTYVEYPKEAKNEGLEGLVVLQFVVEKSGEIAQIKVVKSAGSSLDKAALDALTKLQDGGNIWSPGMQDGKAVNVRYNLPIRFKLD
jgi:TonB family protein